MTTLILWKPLTFWDEEQIEYLRKQEIKLKIQEDKEFNNLRSEYHDKQSEIDELELEQENLYAQMSKIAVKKYWINKKDLWLII